jgi:hypothetical protein
MNSNLLLMKFNVSATSVSSNIKPMFNLLPHVVENFLISVCTGLWSVSWARVVISAAGDVDIVLHKTPHMEWPPRSPNLTPIDFFFALMMKAARTSETSVYIQLRTWQYIPEDSELNTSQEFIHFGDIICYKCSDITGLCRVSYHSGLIHIKNHIFH